MAKILITGAAGYIGSHTLIEFLEKTDYEIVALDNFVNSSSDTYKRVRAICKRNFETAEIDLCDAKALSECKALDNLSGIIHFAALKSVPQSMREPLRYYENNLTGLMNLLRECGKRSINNFIFSSSCSVYGNTSDLPVTENTPWQPAVSAYAHTKQAGEEMIRFYTGAQPGLNAVILRYFNPVGAHMSGLNGEMPIGKPDNLVPIITQTAVGKNTLTVFGNDYDTRDGYCIRDYIHVTDIADAHVKALKYLIDKKNKSVFEVFNLGTGHGVSVKEAIDAFEKVSGRKLDYKMGARREGDVVAVYADNSRAKKVLGWMPVFTLDDMMSSAWKWQQHLEKTASEKVKS